MRAALLLPGVFLIVLTSGCQRKSPDTVDPEKLKVFQPLPAVAVGPAGPPSEELVALGRMLYHDPRLSRSQKISCNSCHDLSRYGVDNEPTSPGHKGQKGDRNSPSVYNAALQFAQFWDGRAADVEEQAKGPVLNPVEMAMPSDKLVVAVLKSIPEYVEAFRRAFPEDKDPVTLDNAARAIGAFERKLITPARWDRFLTGDQRALTREEKAGLNVYLETGCQVCHSGVLLGGDMFQTLGVMKPYPDQSDQGRYQVTKKEADRMVFKVPPLRNIEKTGPYFHNGKVATLEQAVEEMADYQLGVRLSRKEVESIVTFLKCLTGEPPAEYIKAPELPKSTPRTPPPDLSD